MSPGTQVLIQLPGAVALLLWGLGMIRDGVGDALGWRLRRFAGRARGRLFASFWVGAGLGASFQSSTAAILLGGSLAVGGALTTAQGLALALGADVGATLAAQLFGFNLAALAPALIFAGFLLTRFFPRAATRKAALLLVGLGLVLISLRLIYDASEPLRAAAVMRQIFAALDSEPLITVLVFALLAWVCHSSLAAVLIVMSLTAGGGISLHTAFAMTLGANLGAGLIPLTTAAEPEARRIALGNALFRAAGVGAMLPLAAHAAGVAAALDFTPARAVAHFHTFFNLSIAAVFFLLVPACGAWLEKWWRKAADSDLTRPLYLNMERRPEISRALAAATRETLALGDLVCKMLEKSALLIGGDNPAAVGEIKKMESAVDHRNRHIKAFLTKHLGGADDMREPDRLRADAILAAAMELEHIGDAVDHGLLAAAARLHRRQGRLRGDGARELADLYERTGENLHIALDILMSRDPALAREFAERKQRLDAVWRRDFAAHLRRLREGDDETVATSATHLDWVRELKRINGHAAEIADAAMGRVNQPEGLRRRASD